MSDDRPRLPRTLTVSGLILSIAIVAAACSGAGTAATTPPGPTTPPATSSSAVPAVGSVCEDVTALGASIEALGAVDLTAADGVEALKTAIGEVKTSAETLRASASTELASVVDTFTTQVDELQDAVGKLGSGDGSGLLAVGTAIAGLVSAAEDLEAQFKTACP
jgi:hypothetical protein